MSDNIQMIQLSGEPYVILPRAEYDRLRLLAKAEDLPPLPPPDKRGLFPAVEYARISMARKIIQRRAELNLSQKDLADLSGVRVETLCRIETGNATPSTATIERIERGFQSVPQSKRKNKSTAKRQRSSTANPPSSYRPPGARAVQLRSPLNPEKGNP